MSDEGLSACGEAASTGPGAGSASAPSYAAPLQHFVNLKSNSYDLKTYRMFNAIMLETARELNSHNKDKKSWIWTADDVQKALFSNRVLRSKTPQTSSKPGTGVSTSPTLVKFRELSLRERVGLSETDLAGEDDDGAETGVKKKNFRKQQKKERNKSVKTPGGKK